MWISVIPPLKWDANKLLFQILLCSKFWCGVYFDSVLNIKYSEITAALWQWCHCFFQYHASKRRLSEFCINVENICEKKMHKLKKMSTLGELKGLTKVCAWEDATRRTWSQPSWKSRTGVVDTPAVYSHFFLTFIYVFLNGRRCSNEGTRAVLMKNGMLAAHMPGVPLVTVINDSLSLAAWDGPMDERANVSPTSSSAVSQLICRIRPRRTTWKPRSPFVLQDTSRPSLRRDQFLHFVTLVVNHSERNPLSARAVLHVQKWTGLPARLCPSTG